MLDEATGVKTILVVTAHPDDVDFGAAGSVGVWTDRGIDVRYCIVTDGDAGGFDPTVPRSEIPRIRREEQTKAAKTVGVTELHFLGYPDGRLESSLELRRDISRVIRQVRPDRMLCPSPERNLSRLYASHPDHLAAGEAAVCAVYPDARNPWAHPELLQNEGLEPYTVPELWLMATTSADRFVDTTAQMERKVAALLCHESQMPDPSRIPKLITDWGAAVAAMAGLPAGSYAEGFQRIDTA
jgi:LmbE family N-acetylglucosaminyl deacetylase